MKGLTVRAGSSIEEVEPAVWDGLEHGPSPFLRWGFLRALEESGSIGKRTGWTPVYLVAERAGAVVGAVAAFIKTHSYGEYIFDWGWASAAQRAGIRYYPKLVIAAPATPATGNRILLAPGAGAEVRAALIAAVRELAALKSRKRKQLRKERAKARAAIDRLTWVEGPRLSIEQLDDLDRFYRITTDHHGGRDYLRPGFFHALAKHLPEATRMVEVVVGGRRIAGALFLETDAALYGRYWGADAHVDLLHFETAYYAGIERAIDKRLPLFEAGAQGEHKLLRGFEPSPTYSAHWVRHAGLAAAIAEHTERESTMMQHELAELAKVGPYRREGDDE